MHRQLWRHLVRRSFTQNELTYLEFTKNKDLDRRSVKKYARFQDKARDVITHSGGSAGRHTGRETPASKENASTRAHINSLLNTAEALTRGITTVSEKNMDNTKSHTKTDKVIRGSCKAHPQEHSFQNQS